MWLKSLILEHKDLNSNVQIKYCTVYYIFIKAALYCVILHNLFIYSSIRSFIKTIGVKL